MLVLVDGVDILSDILQGSAATARLSFTKGKHAERQREKQFHHFRKYHLLLIVLSCFGIDGVLGLARGNGAAMAV